MTGGVIRESWAGSGSADRGPVVRRSGVQEGVAGIGTAAERRQGQKAEARKEYQEFLSHFGNSKAPLPEIAEARAALKRLT